MNASINRAFTSAYRIVRFFAPSIPFLLYHGQLGWNPCDGSRVVANILFFASIFGLVLEMSRGTELVVESWLVIDTRRGGPAPRARDRARA